MKNIVFTLLLAIGFMPVVFGQSSEEVVNEDDLFAPFRTVYRNVESIDFSTPQSKRQGSIMKHHVYQKHDMMNGVYYGGKLSRTGKQTMGVSIRSNDYSTVRRSASSKGSSIYEQNMASKKKQIARNSEFMKNKQAAMEAARIRDMERKRREKENDDLRASVATAEANAKMQPITNARIANDRYNAGEGLQKARVASRSKAYSQMRGYVKPRRKMTGETATAALTKTHAKRRPAEYMMHSSLHPKLLQNPAVLKKPKPYVYRKVPQDKKYVFTGRMTKTSIYIEPDKRFGVPDKYNAPATISSNRGFRLSPNAVVTTGQLIDNGELKPKYIPERPKTSDRSLMDTDKDLVLEEFFPELYKK